MLEGTPKKSQKNHFFRPPFGGRFETVFSVFKESEFSTFSEPLFYHISGPRDAQRVHFWGTLGAKSNTSWIHLEKWKLHYRSRGDTKIKLLRVCVSLGSIIYRCVLSKPLMFTLHRLHNSHYAQFMDPFGTPFWTQICNNILIIFLVIFSSNYSNQNENRAEASVAHHGGGGNWKPSRSHLGAIWEASRSQEAPGGSRRSGTEKVKPLSAKT